MGPCEVGADRQTVRGGKGVYNSGARRITVFCWSSETSAIKTQTPGNYPKRNILQATISFVISVLPSVRIEQLGVHWTEFHEILFFIIFRGKITVENIQVPLKLDKNEECMTTNMHF